MCCVGRVPAGRSGRSAAPIWLVLLLSASASTARAAGAECVVRFSLFGAPTCEGADHGDDVSAATEEDGDGDEPEGAEAGGAEAAPEPVTSASQAFLLSLAHAGGGRRSDETATWRRRASVGVGWDDNPASATSAAIIPKWGLPSILPERSRKRGAFFAQLRAEIDHRQPWGEGRDWLTYFSVTGRKTDRVTDYDAFNATLFTGPRWLLDPRVTMDLPLRTSIGRFVPTDGNDPQRWQSWEVAVAPRIGHEWSEGLEVFTEGTIGRRTHFAEPGKTSTFMAIASGVTLKTKDFGTFSIAPTFRREPTRLSTEANSSTGVDFGWRHRPHPAVALSLHGTIATICFDETEPIYGAERRRDERVSIGGETAWTIEDLGADLVVGFEITRNRSNQPLHAFDRDITTIALRKPF